jgi:hypothetical protein
MSSRKWERRVREVATEHGCTVQWGGNGHMQIVGSNGRKVVASASPKDPDHAIKRVRSDVRRYLAVP